MIESLFSRKLLFNLGKGGVGKTVVTALLARQAEEAGLRVLICEVNSKERMSSLFGRQTPTDFQTLDRIWQISERIWAVDIQPWAAMKEYVSQILGMKLLYNLVFENRLIRYFLHAIPGLQELVFVGKIWFHVDEDKLHKKPRFDLVIVDCPATGHGLAMLRIAKVVLDTVPRGPMYTAAEKIQALLQDPTRTCVNLITLPEEMPVNETIELYHKLHEEIQVPFGGLFVNQWPLTPISSSTRPLFEATHPQGLSDAEAWPLYACAQNADRIHQRAEGFLHLLQEALPLPLQKIPKVSASPHDPTAILEEILHHLPLSSRPDGFAYPRNL